MSFLSGIFAHKINSSGNASKSKRLCASPTIPPSRCHSSTSAYDTSTSAAAASLTAEYVSVSSAGPSSPNGRGLAYAGEPNPHPQQKGKTRGSAGGGLWFFGRKRSWTYLAPPMQRGSAQSRRSLPPTQPHSPFSPTSSLSPAYDCSPAGGPYGSGGGGSHPHLGSSLVLSTLLTKLTARRWTARSAGTKSAGAKSGGILARLFGTGKTKEKDKESGRAGIPTPRPRGKDGECTQSEFGLRDVSPSASSSLSPAPNSRADGNKLTTVNLSALNASSWPYPAEEDLASPRRPRPRGTSDASASSSRISVAAFREVQAQRSVTRLGGGGVDAGANGSQPNASQRPLQQQQQGERPPRDPHHLSHPQWTPPGKHAHTQVHKSQARHRQENDQHWESTTSADSDSSSTSSAEEDEGDFPSAQPKAEGKKKGRPAMYPRRASKPHAGNGQGGGSTPGVYGMGGEKSAVGSQSTGDVSAVSQLAGTAPRQRSSILVPVASTSTFEGFKRTTTTTAFTSAWNSDTSSSAPSHAASSTSGCVAHSPSINKTSAPSPRQRSSTMMPLGKQTRTSQSAPVPASALTPTAASAPAWMLRSVIPPTRPFVAPPMQRNSPASSTGDSSGPWPLTPRDGSDIGGVKGERACGGREDVEKWSGLVPRKPTHQWRSVSFDFDDDVVGDGKAKAKARAQPQETALQEERRKERRRREARAVIELVDVTVIDGPGPVPEDDKADSNNIPMSQPWMKGNPMAMTMGMNMSMGNGARPNALGPAQLIVPPPADASFYAAHQQAMISAKHAYQMAVAQQAMAAAGEEWARGSSFGGGGGRESVFAGSMLGVLPPVVDSFVMGMPDMEMSGLFPLAPRLMYGGARNGARSEYSGGGGVGGNWSSSRSVYGETFGPSTERYTCSSSRKNLTAQGGKSSAARDREAGYFPPIPASSSSRNGGRSGTGTARQRTASQPRPSKNVLASNWETVW
ncbi:hypothetical protein C8R45DRAFT_1103442 [Mycena sanguinolenta]|nr:hypothetical protein C8R45DRAFT_1103442 [Mycena sanguinolenta]